MEKIHKHGGKSSENLLDKNIIIKALKIHPGQNILDAGCGNGYMSKEFAKLVGSAGKIYAIDAYEESIKQLKSETDYGNMAVMLGDITKKTEIEDSSIDLIYLSMVFHGFTSSQRVSFLNEVKRILKPGGILAIVEINKGDTPFGPPTDVRVSPEEMAEKVRLDKETLIKIGDYFYMQTFIHSHQIKLKNI